MNSNVFVGNLTADPVLRTSAEGKNRATFTIAVNEGERGTDNEKSHFVNLTAFGTLGENVAKSLKKGMRVVAVGRLDTYQKAVQIDGEDKNLGMVSFIASAVGPDLRWAEADVRKVVSGNGNSNGNGGQQAAAPAATQAAAPAPAAAAAAPAGGDDDF